MENIRGIDNDALYLRSGHPQYNNPYNDRQWCEMCEMWYDDCPCDSDVETDPKNKDFNEILMEKMK